MTSLDHAYSLCMFYRCMGDFNAGGFCELLEQFSGENGSFICEDVCWNVCVFGEYRQKGVDNRLCVRFTQWYGKHITRKYVDCGQNVGIAVRSGQWSNYIYLQKVSRAVTRIVYLLQRRAEV